MSTLTYIYIAAFGIPVLSIVLYAIPLLRQHQATGRKRELFVLGLGIVLLVVISIVMLLSYNAANG